MRHVCRPGPFRRETIVDLGDDGLDVMDGTSRHIALRDIARVRLRTTMYDLRGQFICEVESRTGDRVVLNNVSYGHWAGFEDRTATWRPLVDSLHRRLAQLDPPPQFTAGDQPGWFAAHIGVWAFLVLFALGLMVGNVVVGSLVLLVILGLAILYWRRRMRPNRPRPYNPLALPPELLPVPKADAQR